MGFFKNRAPYEPPKFIKTKNGITRRKPKVETIINQNGFKIRKRKKAE